ncbi:MAG: SAM-dependent methyltransferase [Halobacteriaceae archaeon]
MSDRDEYYNRAKVEGYRSRAAYKLKQLDEAADLFADGDTVVDLGAAPGGWLQVAAERVGGDGRVVGVDFQSIDSVDRPADVVTLRGDMTEAATGERIRAALAGADEAARNAVDASHRESPLVGDSGTDQPDEAGTDDASADGEPHDATADVVVSDMAPDLTGEYSVDHARSVHLARQALDTALAVLAPGGDFVVKVFDGQDLRAFVEDVEAEFEYAREVRPDASRDASSELYVVGKGRLTAPVRTGDVLTVTVTDEGSEGDGVASVDGYTLFVAGAEPGEELAVEVTGVKPRFGFAEPVPE